MVNIFSWPAGADGLAVACASATAVATPAPALAVVRCFQCPRRVLVAAPHDSCVKPQADRSTRSLDAASGQPPKRPQQPRRGDGFSKLPRWHRRELRAQERPWRRFRLAFRPVTSAAGWLYVLALLSVAKLALPVYHVSAALSWGPETAADTGVSPQTSAWPSLSLQ